MQNLSADTHALQIRDLRVDYGEHVAVHDFSLEIPPGEIFGLVGPNGAGKTSTFRVLATLMEPTYGDVFLCGLDIFEKRRQVRTLLGYMPDLAPVPSDLKVWEFLDLFGASHGLPPRARRDIIAKALDHVDLEEKRQDYCKNLSRGMKQRLALAKTILHRPRVMLLDEPASGMDPVSRVALRKTLQALAAEGTTVVVSSHILSELSAMCTSVGIMSKGRLVVAGTMEEVVGQFAKDKTLTVHVLGGMEQARTLLSGHSDCHEVEVKLEQGELRCRFKGDAHAQTALLGEMVSRGCQVLSFSEEKEDIETIMLGLEDTQDD